MVKKQNRLINIALISPSQNAISETFIKRHQNSFTDNTIMYYGGNTPQYSEKDGEIPGSDIIYYLQKIGNKFFALKIDLHKEALTRSFKRNRISVCYAEFGTAGVEVMHVCKKLQIPLIVNFHGFDISMYHILSKYTDRYKEMFSIASIIVGVSKSMCSKLILLGCPEEKIRHIPCFPDPYFFDVQPKIQSNKLLCIGRFVDKKAQYLTLLAFKKVIKDLPETELLFVGDGPLLNMCQNLVKVMDIKNVTFYGACEHQFVQSLFSDCAIFLQHSITASSGDQEGTPVAIMEACASGVPVVATKHAGIPDIVQDGKMGYLVDELDVDKMAEKIIHLLKNRDQMGQISTYSKSFMESHYSDEKYRNDLNEIINDSLI